MNEHVRDMLQEEAAKLGDAIGADDPAATARRMARLGSFLPQLMKDYRASAEMRRNSRTPRWRFVRDFLECLAANRDAWVAPREVMAWIGESMRDAFTAADLKAKPSGGARVSWWNEALWLKRMLLMGGLVSDNGRRGPASRWRITADGEAMLSGLWEAGRGADRMAREWYRGMLPQCATAA